VRPLVSPAEMREADEHTMAAGTTAETLMERAGRAVARTVVRALGGRYGRRVTVLCGKGNNGGDGFVAARVLHEEGVRVICSTVFEADTSEGPAAHHLALLRSAGCPVLPFAESHLQADAVVDAVFGTGFSGEPRAEAARALAALGRSRPPLVVAIDVPSAGMVPAHVTVALGAEKLQTFFGDASADGTVEVADIGIPVPHARVHVLGAVDVAGHLPHANADDHKTSHGSVVVLAGSNRTTGAPLLTARGAARMGSGYVTLGSTERVIAAAETRLPEILKAVVGGGEVVGPGALDELADALERADAVALGPGLGIGDDQRKLVLRALRELDHPLVLDADALNVMTEDAEVIAGREASVVITPHAGELARLLQRALDDVLGDRPQAALDAAERFGCTVVLKGRGSLVAAPSDTGASALVVPVGGPELATAGTGDVLTGAMAALLARGGDPQLLAAAACYAHGVAGDIVAEELGDVGVVAWEVAEALPKALASLAAPLP
jgi:ADP-dependent NAD(P)H-hydrate dehydratase / NAD(P)H-hydrate epimerase